MKPPRPRSKSTIADCTGGEVVRTAAGLLRVLHRTDGALRWALLLRDDGTETRDRIWLAGSTRIEVVQEAATRVAGGQDETDPLLAGGREWRR